MNILILLVILIPFLLLTMWALVDVSIKTFSSLGEKATWWIVALIPFIGWLIYLVFGARRGTKQSPAA
jgi:uncharacterized membrane protein YhaH (DUF805 family)